MSDTRSLTRVMEVLTVIGRSSGRRYWLSMAADRGADRGAGARGAVTRRDSSRARDWEREERRRGGERCSRYESRSASAASRSVSLRSGSRSESLTRHARLRSHHSSLLSVALSLEDKPSTDRVRRLTLIDGLLVRRKERGRKEAAASDAAKQFITCTARVSEGERSVRASQPQTSTQTCLPCPPLSLSLSREASRLPNDRERAALKG